MATSRVVWPDAEIGSNAFLSTITDKCDPDQPRGVAVDARSVAEEMLCAAHDVYTDVHNKVQVTYNKLRSEHNPCRINPKIKTKVYTDKSSTYTFFGWPLGEMAEDGAAIVRTNKKCHICAFSPPVKVEGEGALATLRKTAKKYLSKNEGNLRCNIDHTGKALRDHKPRLAALNLFDEDVAQGTSAWRTLDHTVEQAMGKMAERDPFWAKVSADIKRNQIDINELHPISLVRHRDKALAQLLGTQDQSKDIKHAPKCITLMHK